MTLMPEESDEILTPKDPDRDYLPALFTGEQMDEFFYRVSIPRGGLFLIPRAAELIFVREGQFIVACEEITLDERENIIDLIKTLEEFMSGPSHIEGSEQAVVCSALLEIAKHALRCGGHIMVFM